MFGSKLIKKILIKSLFWPLIMDGIQWNLPCYPSLLLLWLAVLTPPKLKILPSYIKKFPLVNFENFLFFKSWPLGMITNKSRSLYYLVVTRINQIFTLQQDSMNSAKSERSNQTIIKNLFTRPHKIWMGHNIIGLIYQLQKALNDNDNKRNGQKSQ